MSIKLSLPRLTIRRLTGCGGEHYGSSVALGRFRIIVTFKENRKIFAEEYYGEYTLGLFILILQYDKIGWE